MATLTLRIITPERIVIDTQVESVTLPFLDGEAGILPRHAPMIAALNIGTLVFRTPAGPSQEMFVSGGFAEVKDNTVRVVVQSGESADDIDETRALEAEKRARTRLEAGLQESGKPLDILRAQASLRRAIMRLRTKRGQ